jgi:hypothetical protein
MKMATPSAKVAIANDQYTSGILGFACFYLPCVRQSSTVSCPVVALADFYHLAVRLASFGNAPRPLEKAKMAEQEAIFTFVVSGNVGSRPSCCFVLIAGLKSQISVTYGGRHAGRSSR